MVIACIYLALIKNYIPNKILEVIVNEGKIFLNLY